MAEEIRGIGLNTPEDITQMLVQWRAGDDLVLQRLTETIYSRLRALAGRVLAKDWGNRSLQATELVHEAYVKLLRARSVDWKDRTHFFLVAAKLMRQILVDRARARGAKKRHCGAAAISLEAEGLDLIDETGHTMSVLRLHEALSELENLDDHQVRVVEMRFFAGMTVEETAVALGVSSRTVKREWRMAKAWLRRRLAEAA